MKNKIKKFLSDWGLFVVLYGIGALVVGWSYGIGRDYDEHKAVHIVQAGETFWGITQHYAQLDEKSRCLQEFQCNVEEDNPHLNLSKSYLQPGDKVTVVWYTVSQK